ncbi:excalibur calcium-binding domain-containing protein [Actinomycetospora flava]|uniref:Excalibur calcium-binding domain-containing protein n=1 Tax=Actinomycetospora flava TaxID=3129232 RepID=A0ABU8LXN8_9PSEU
MSALLFLGTAGPALAVPAVYYANCTEAFAAGVQNIPQGTPGYRPALDRDRDGVACDQGDPANAAGARTVTDEAVDVVDAVDPAEPAQVEVVPVGAAPTGDGSSVDLDELVEQDAPAASVSSSVLWWSGGGLGVLLACLVAGRRPSSQR